jgi:tetratricopeptide (TPR) repeat protein
MEDPSLSPSKDDSDLNPEIKQNIKGDRNQGIGINSGTAFGNIEGSVYLNQQPKCLSLHQLPSDIADFTGRTTEIDTIRQQLLSGKSLVISAVAGMPGVGKSALAIHIAQQLAESAFPDVQLYVDLRGADGDGLEPGAVLAGFLRAFGFNESNIPRDLQERASVYRSQLMGKRSIVLLDNAQDEAQVRPLLPGNDCAVIITSRRVLGALAGTKIFNLMVLSEGDAYDLLAKLVGIERLQAEPEAAAEILRLCDGLPLAILIAGGMLKSKLHWRLADYSQRLTDEKQRLEHLQLSDLSVRASFELSYQQLSPADGMLFSRLGILVGKDFGEELAAVLHDSDSPVIDGIERLIDAQLLEVTIDRRYHFHDLLRLFAREKLTESSSLEQQEEIKQQIVDWGHNRSKFNNACLDPVKRRQMLPQWIESGEVDANFDEQSLMMSALAWFEKERVQLFDINNWANDMERWDVVVSFSAQLLLFYQTRSYWADGEKTCLIAITAAYKSGNRYSEGKSINNLGQVYQSQSRWDEAIDCHLSSLNIFRELEHRYGEGQSFNNLGMVYNSQSRWDEAIDCLQHSLTIFQELGDRYGEGISLNNLGVAYRSKSQWDKAIDCHQNSLIIKQELGDRYGESQSFNNLGNVYQSQGHWNDAIDCYQDSLTILRELGYRHGEANSLNNLGNVYQVQNQWDDAIDCYLSSLKIFRELLDRHGESASLNNLGVAYRSQRRWSPAINCYQQGFNICRELKDRHGEAQILGNLGNIYQSQNRFDKAVNCYEKSSYIFLELGDRASALKTLENMRLIHEKLRHDSYLMVLDSSSIDRNMYNLRSRRSIFSQIIPLLALIILLLVLILIVTKMISGHWILAVAIISLVIGGLLAHFFRRYS